MSIYQTRPKPPINEFASQPSTRGGVRATACPLPGAQLSEQELPRLRKAKPVNYLLPMSIGWLASLPIEVRPNELARHFPRIANLVALQWSNSAACRAYFDDLLTDHRGTRKGFPPDVHREIVALRNFHYNQDWTLQE